MSAVTFGKFCLDLATRQLFHDNSEVRLTPKAFDLLQTLIENRMRAVSKTELQEHLWPDSFITEATLASVVAELRRALDDDSRAPKFVRTVQRFGYAFCGTVDGDAHSQPDRVSAVRASACWLLWNGRELPLADGEHVLGRDADATVRLDSPSVSRRHARVIVSDATVTVEDLASKNGTRVGDRIITAPAVLCDRDELTVGSVRMVIRILRGGEPTQTQHG